MLKQSTDLKIQVLIATMNQRDHSLLDKMNISTSAIVGNQCDRNTVEKFEFNGQNIIYLNFNESGVGLNRNNALIRADADIVMFADDDMVYEKDYENIVKNSFCKYPNADVIIFNLKEENSQRKVIKNVSKVGYFNYLRYGTARIAVRLKVIRNNGILFNQCFGGGTSHCHGEDNLFINNCLRCKLTVIAVPEYIAALTNERESSWNHGYNKKYLLDQGALYYALSKRWWRLLCFQDALRRHKSYKRGILNTFLIMTKGAKNFKLER